MLKDLAPTCCGGRLVSHPTRRGEAFALHLRSEYDAPLMLSRTFLAVLCVACSFSAFARTKSLMGEVTILSATERPPFPWGVIATWIEFEVAFPNGTRGNVYLPYMTNDRPLPIVGARCRLTATEEFIQGSTMAGPVEQDYPALVASSLACNGVEYRP